MERTRTRTHTDTATHNERWEKLNKANERLVSLPQVLKYTGCCESFLFLSVQPTVPGGFLEEPQPVTLCYVFWFGSSCLPVLLLTEVGEVRFERTFGEHVSDLRPLGDGENYQLVAAEFELVSQGFPFTH